MRGCPWAASWRWIRGGSGFSSGAEGVPPSCTSPQLHPSYFLGLESVEIVFFDDWEPEGCSRVARRKVTTNREITREITSDTRTGHTCHAAFSRIDHQNASLSI